MLVELSITDNEGRPAAFLLMARPRIERNGNEVAFSWNVAPQLPCLTADGRNVAPQLPCLTADGTMLDRYLAWSLETGIPTDLSQYSAVTVNRPDSSSSGLYLTYSVDNLSGTWQTWEAPRPDDPALLSFYIVKAGNDFSLFWVDPAQDKGNWSVEHLPLNANGQFLQVSHVTAYVPEPSSAILLGTGLLGLFCFNRKRFIK